MTGGDPTIDSSQVNYGLHAVRVYSDATGEGGLASLAALSLPERPATASLIGRDPEELRELAVCSSKIYIFELCAAAATSVMGQKGNSVRGRRGCLRGSDERRS